MAQLFANRLVSQNTCDPAQRAHMRAVAYSAHDSFECVFTRRGYCKLNQLAEHLVFGLAHKRNFDALRSQEIGQQFSVVSGKTES